MGVGRLADRMEGVHVPRIGLSAAVVLLMMVVLGVFLLYRGYIRNREK